MTDARRAEIIKKFLRYSFGDITGSEPMDVQWDHYDYTGLTGQEQEICTEQEFNELVAWVKEG